MLLTVLLLIVSLALILTGANLLTDGASAIARRMRISNLVIGLTVVALGTSAPELVISVMAALDGNSGIAIGNVMGSNIFNILMIVGVTACIAPIRIGRGTMSKEIPLVILASLVLWVLGDKTAIGSAGENVLTRSDGLVLLAFFLIFMAYTFSIARSAEGEEGPEVKDMPLWRSVVYIVLGLAGLIWGGDMFVDSASEIASGLGVSDAVIGLTIVALGTSLPELATSVVAALKKNPDMAIGNVIGSSLFNIFFILGAAATIAPMPVCGITGVDYGALIGSAVLLWLTGMVIGKREVRRVEGVIMVACYVGYTVWLLMSL